MFTIMSKRYGSITPNYLPPIKKILSILVKDSLKIEIKFVHGALCHMKTTALLKYFVHACSLQVSLSCYVTH